VANLVVTACLIVASWFGSPLVASEGEGVLDANARLAAGRRLRRPARLLAVLALTIILRLGAPGLEKAQIAVIFGAESRPGVISPSLASPEPLSGATDTSP
jgi:hypothetical protein